MGPGVEALLKAKKVESSQSDKMEDLPKILVDMVKLAWKSEKVSDESKFYYLLVNWANFLSS